MKRHLASVLLLACAGCASGPPFIDQMEPTATAKAETRARFDLDCPDAKGQVINREQLQPLVFSGPVRAQYTIGVTGCGKRTMVTVLCSDNGNQCVERGAAG
jgi:dephospho-CoA kinase